MNVYGPTGPIARNTSADGTTNASAAYYLSDPLGNIAHVTDGSGYVESSHGYTAHGQSMNVAWSGASTNQGAYPWGYKGTAGYYSDQSTSPTC